MKLPSIRDARFKGPGLGGENSPVPGPKMFVNFQRTQIKRMKKLAPGPQRKILQNIKSMRRKKVMEAAILEGKIERKAKRASLVTRGVIGGAKKLASGAARANLMATRWRSSQYMNPWDLKHKKYYQALQTKGKSPAEVAGMTGTDVFVKGVHADEKKRRLGYRRHEAMTGEMI
jgi:hypothetical protein